MSTVAPYGTWTSPITPGTITTRTVRLSQVRIHALCAHRQP